MRHLDHFRLDDHDRGRMVLFDVHALYVHHFFTRHGSCLSHGQVFFQFASLAPSLQACINALTNRLGQPQPRKAKHPRHAHQHEGDEHQPRPIEAQHQLPTLTDQATQRPACLAHGTAHATCGLIVHLIPAIQAGPFQPRAGQEQQQKPHPKRPPAVQPSALWAVLPAATQGAPPSGTPRQPAPPHRIAHRKIAQARQPSAQASPPIGHGRGARPLPRGQPPRWVAAVITEQ